MKCLIFLLLSTLAFLATSLPILSSPVLPVLPLNFPSFPFVIPRPNSLGPRSTAAENCMSICSSTNTNTTACHLVCERPSLLNGSSTPTTPMLSGARRIFNMTALIESIRNRVGTRNLLHGGPKDLTIVRERPANATLSAAAASLQDVRGPATTTMATATKTKSPMDWHGRFPQDDADVTTDDESEVEDLAGVGGEVEDFWSGVAEDPYEALPADRFAQYVDVLEDVAGECKEGMGGC